MNSNKAQTIRDVFLSSCSHLRVPESSRLSHCRSSKRPSSLEPTEPHQTLLHALLHHNSRCGAKADVGLYPFICISRVLKSGRARLTGSHSHNLHYHFSGCDAEVHEHSNHTPLWSGHCVSEPWQHRSRDFETVSVI